MVNCYTTILLIAFVAISNAFTISQTSARAATDLKMTVLNYNGKKVNFKAGSPLKNAVGKLGVKPRYSCKK